ncbi:hypothetical protein L3V86_05260 [Thiotrichales bacterium 19S11-10]|nr:hypothetical protein [Thiotrichales bacterium 19S11-10]
MPITTANNRQPRKTGNSQKKQNTVQPLDTPKPYANNSTVSKEKKEELANNPFKLE